MSSRWNKANIARGLCARCGAPRTHYANHCDRCQAKYNARVQRREGFQPWCPGKQGRIPNAIAPYVHTAEIVRATLLKTDEYRNDEALGRAAIVMVVGFLFRQRLDWIVGWTGFSKAECKAVVARLYRYGVWNEDGSIACHWMDALLLKKPKKRDLWKADVAFWLDALVAKGEVTREPTDDDFLYGLVEWERRS